MATWYVDSTATGTGAGTSWTNACTTMAAAITLSAAGDDFNVYSGHSESTSSALTLTFPGTAAAPNRILSCDRTNAPAQASDLLAGATIATTGASTLTVAGFLYAYGLTLSAGSAASTANLTLASAAAQQTWEACLLKLGNSSASSILSVGGANADMLLNNTTVQFGSVSQLMRVSNSRLRWMNTAAAINTGGSMPTTLISGNGMGVVIASGVDFSGLGSGKSIVSNWANPAIVQLINCRLNASVGVSATITSPANVFVDLVNCDSGATGYRQERYRYQGTLTTSITVYNNASDGVTPISWAVTTSANAKRQSPFECFDIVQWVPAGTFAASVVQITSATAGLTNADVWVEAEYLGNASYPLASPVSSAPATQLTAGSALAAGTWATGGLGHNYELQVPSFTTAMAGYVRFTVKVAKPSITVNIDPAVTVA